MSDEKRSYQKDGFTVRMEARLKNAELKGAREIIGLTIKQTAELLEMNP
jgi:hypothetical protein